MGREEEIEELALSRTKPFECTKVICIGNPGSVSYLENIVREAIKGRDKALDLNEDWHVDHYQKIIDDTRYFLPIDNRFKK